MNINYAPVSVTTFVEVPKLVTHSPRNILANAVVVVFADGINLATFEKCSFFTTIYWLPLLVFGRWLSMSMEINCSGFYVRKTVIFVVVLLFPVTCAQFTIYGCSVDLVFHMKPVVLVAHCVEPVPFPQMICQYRVMPQVKDYRAVDGWYVYLNCFF